MRTFVRWLARRLIAFDKVASRRLGIAEHAMSVGVALLAMLVIFGGIMSIIHIWDFVIVPGMFLLALDCWVIAEIAEIEQEEKHL